MKILITTALCALAAVSLSAADADIRLMDTIAIEAPTIELGEIAYIESDDPELQEQLAQIELLPAPNPGSPRIVSAYYVKTLIDEHGLAERCQVLGQQSIVSVDLRPVGDEEIIGLISEWVSNNIPEDAEGEIDYVKLPPRWKIPTGNKVKITVDPLSRKTVGTLSIMLRAVVDDKVLATTRARVHVSLYRNSLVLIRPIQRTEILTNEHVEVRRSNITKSTGMEVAHTDQVIGYAAKRDLPIGTLLSVDHIEKPYLVQRGSINRIMVRNGTINLNIAGAEALQNGREDEIVMFTNPMNRQQPLKARIVGPGLAVIELR